jgi:hypothetical protein
MTKVYCYIANPLYMGGLYDFFFEELYRCDLGPWLNLHLYMYVLIVFSMKPKIAK